MTHQIIQKLLISSTAATCLILKHMKISNNQHLWLYRSLQRLPLFASHVTIYCRPTPTLWRRGVVVITTAQLHSPKFELRFCGSSNPARSMSEICYGGNLQQSSWVEIRLNAFRRSNILQIQFIIIITNYISSICNYPSLVRSPIKPGVANWPH